MDENKNQTPGAQAPAKAPLKDLMWRLPSIAIFAWLSLSSFGAAVQIQSGYNGLLVSMCWWAYLAATVAMSQITVTFTPHDKE